MKESLDNLKATIAAKEQQLFELRKESKFITREYIICLNAYSRLCSELRYLEEDMALMELYKNSGGLTQGV